MNQIVQAEESIKLYEYPSFKPDLDEGTLEHFGILGMHWGQRNGPPYPLNSKISTGKRLKKGAGAPSGSVSRKRRKALKKARKARANNLKIKTMEKQTKEDIIKNKDLKSMLQNVDKFTSQEINDMLNRLDVERRLADKVREVEKANMSRGQKIKEGFKESVYEGAAKTGRQLVKTATSNTLKIAAPKVFKSLGYSLDSPEAKKWDELVDRIFKEEKKK